MFRLTREVRFGVDVAPPRAAEDARPAPANAYAGHPPLTGLGHYFVLRATVAGELDPASSYLLNIKDVDRAVREVAVPLVEEVVRRRPAEVGPGLLVRLFETLRPAWAPARLEALALGLSPFLWWSCRGSELPMTRLSQKFEFAASHRLHNPALPDAENRLIFGKCNNPHGHGHNYELQVTLAGTPDESGLLVDVPEFERIVDRVVIGRFDHKNLNVEVPEFADLIPSVENIARVIYRLLKPALRTPRSRLASVTVWETPKTWCEYSEESSQ